MPTGSCEQHGPHLPLDTDTLIAEALADALAARRSDALVSPSIAIGASGEHRSFPGTLSIGTAALCDVAVELARSALAERPASLRAGSVPSAEPETFTAVLFVNGHGGNIEALARAVELLRSECRAAAAWHARVRGGDPHAGRTETSLLLHLHPERVRMDLAEPGSEARFSEIAEVLRTRGLAAVTPNGVLGDPTGATAAEGATVFTALADDLYRSADELHPASAARSPE